MSLRATAGSLDLSVVTAKDLTGIKRVACEGKALDWMVQVSPDERAFGSLSHSTRSLAFGSLHENGCVLLRGAFHERIVDSIHREFVKRLGSLDAEQIAAEAMRGPPNPIVRVGGHRYEIALEMSGAFAAPEVFANPLLLNLLTPVLGNDMRLSGFTSVVSYPGADLQHIHRDHAQLFPDQNIGQELPVYAVNVSVPLMDIDLETGPTAIWLGSHRSPDGPVPRMETATTVPFKRGDAILIDYRTFHTGMPNRSERVRPILYLVYARTWFFDEINHTQRSSLEMPLAIYNSLPQYAQVLLLRAFRYGITRGS